jgi:hypothetical protein
MDVVCSSRAMMSEFFFIRQPSQFQIPVRCNKKNQGGTSIYMYSMLPWFVYDTSRAVLSPLMNRVKKHESWPCQMKRSKFRSN